MAELTPLDQVPGVDETVRKKLEEYWITSAEELVSAARGSNQQYGSGLKALSVALGMDESQVQEIVIAAMDISPDAASFSVDTEMDVGDGLIIEGLPEIEPSFASFAELPEKVDPPADLPPVPNQGRRNSCVAFSLAAMFQALSKDPTDLSEQFLYWACKDRDGIRGDRGTNPLVGLKVLQELGVCAETVWPYKPEPVDHTNPGHERPDQSAFADAKRRRIKSFQQIAGKDFRQIQLAISEGKPVLIGLRIQEHWTTTGQARRLGKVRAPLPGERTREGHAMCALGYRDDPSAPGGGYFIVRNSWGPDWASDNPDGAGYCHVPYKLIFEHGLVAFAAEGVQEYTEEVVSGPAAAGVGARLGGSGEGDSLAELHSAALEIQARVNDLVARLAALTGGAPAPAPVAAGVGPVDGAGTAALQPAAPAAAPQSTFSGPLILIKSDEPGGGDELYPNGIDGETGQPLLRIDAATAAKLAQGLTEPKDMQNLYKAKQTAASGSHFGTVSDIDQTKVEHARWAVVVNGLESADVLKAIWPLVQRRMEQLGFSKREFDFRAGENCATWLNRHTDSGKKDLRSNWGEVPPVLIYRPGERVNGWLARHGVANGPVDPRRGVPFYLMLLGRPGPLADGDEVYIPLNFQYELDIFWGVGRLVFTDEKGQHRLDAYTKYGERVAAFERRADAAAQLSKEVVYFGTKHQLDKSTIASAEQLIAPLSQWHGNKENWPTKLNYKSTVLLEGQATRSALEKIVAGGAGKTPAVLFTATHGLGLKPNNPRIVHDTGALVTQDWTGFGNISREHWFSADDLGTNRSLDGMIAFLFACYGAGCPRQDEFIFDEAKGRPVIAPFPFIAQLPQQLLLNGCLAVMGHVERAWTYSFQGTEGVKGQSQPFEDVLGRLLQGQPAGSATDDFNVIQGARSMTLTEELENIKFGKTPDPTELSKLWMARNDARNYALLGDPAVRLPYEVPAELKH